jgi:hypothetical protein
MLPSENPYITIKNIIDSMNVTGYSSVFAEEKVNGIVYHETLEICDLPVAVQGTRCSFSTG